MLPVLDTKQITIAVHVYANDNHAFGLAYKLGLPGVSDTPSPGWSSDDDWSRLLYGGKDTGGTYDSATRTEIPGRRKLHLYTTGWEA